MRLVRHGFETNSSSTHSLTIGKIGIYDSITPNDYNTILLEQYTFGWDNKIYQSPTARLAYAYIYARDWSKGRPQHMELLQWVVRQHTGADRVEMVGEGINKYPGYIDHQSVECGKLDYLFEDSSLLKSFIFDINSYIETDSDG